MGTSKTCDDLFFGLMPHFTKGSYDVILKNCNSFTDCALYFLLGIRLKKCYSATERYLRENIGIERFQVMTYGVYESNTTAREFMTEDVIRILDGRVMGVEELSSL